MNADRQLLEMALVGYEAKRAELQATIKDIKEQLAPTVTTKIEMVSWKPMPVPKKHHISAAARRNMAAAQRKRWAKVNKLHRVA